MEKKTRQDDSHYAKCPKNAVKYYKIASIEEIWMLHLCI